MTLDTALVASAVHLALIYGGRLRARTMQLEQTNRELADREEEIARQNEELQTQTEELERQSEELRHSNDQIARREQMLESLLGLARSLHTGLSTDQSMTQICRALAELADSPQTSSGVLLQHGGVMRVACHHGFSGGLETDRIPFSVSFASLVNERNRTGYLEDVSLRPDLQIPQPVGGARNVAVLSTPLKIRGRVVGTLEIYSHERRSWSEEQVSLIESLASQASISLENAELFEKIRDERSRLAAVLKTAPIGLMIANRDLSDVRLNHAGAAMLNVSPEANHGVVDGHLPWRLVRGGRQITLDEHPLSLAATQGRVVSGEEVEVISPGGRRFEALVSATPLHDAEGRVIGAVASMVDISVLKDLQQELDNRRRVAEESSARKSRFLATVSHDIRTPANAISLLAELIARTSSNPTMVGEVSQLARELQASALSLVNLVSDVLDITRLDTGHVELSLAPFPLAQVLADECRQLELVAQQKGLELICGGCKAGLVVNTDRVKLGRILGNLLSNALKFTIKGRVETWAEPGEDGEVLINVRDTGVGIPPDALAYIFDEFYQIRSRGAHLGQDWRTPTGGSGLGLTICQRLATAMGGTIRVESEPGAGSTFTVVLPRSCIVHCEGQPA